MYNTIDAFILQLDAGRLRDRREAAHRDLHRGRHREAGEPAARRRPPQGRVALRRRERRHRPPRQQRAEGAPAVPEGQGLHRPQRRDRHHRRVHRPHDARPPLFGRPAPGARGQGARGDPAGEPDARLGHLPELLPHVQEARRHDRHGADGSRGIRQHLRSRSHRGADQPAGQAASTRTTRSTGPSRRNTRRSSARSSEAREKGQPILVGTTSIEKSEQLAERLRKDGFKDFEVLNARHHEREAAIVAQAGKPGAITIATNMAGRGTDIQLGGNADMRIAEELADMPAGPERDAEGSRDPRGRAAPEGKGDRRRRPLRARHRAP